MRSAAAVTAVVVLMLLARSSEAADRLSTQGARLLKHATAMGKKDKVSAYDERRLEKLLAATPREELTAVAARLLALAKATEAHRALAARMSALFWEAEYPGAVSIPDFARAVASRDSPERARLLRAAFGLEDLTTAVKLAVRTVGWSDPAARRAAAVALGDLLDLAAKDDEVAPALIGLLKDGDPEVRCVAAERLEQAGRKEAIDAYVAALEDTEKKVVKGEAGAEETFCFGSRAFYRLARLSRRHEDLEHEDYLAKPEEGRAAIALDFASWWRDAKAAFSFQDTKWEKFAAVPVVHTKVIPLSRPADALFRFRSPRDRSMVTIELRTLEFAAAREKPGTWEASWTLSLGVAGRRSGYESISARKIPANRRHAVPRMGLGHVSMVAQRIGENRARVVVRFADFEGRGRRLTPR